MFREERSRVPDPPAAGSMIAGVAERDDVARTLADHQPVDDALTGCVHHRHRARAVIHGEQCRAVRAENHALMPTACLDRDLGRDREPIGVDHRDDGGLNVVDEYPPPLIGEGDAFRHFARGDRSVERQPREIET